MIREADWKKEKHAPVIEAPETVAVGEPFQVTVSIGKEIPHPNTTEHHIRWIDVYFKPEGDNFTYHVGHFEFTAHGESVKGANEGPVHTHPLATFSMQVQGPGDLVALSLCNIHGLWENAHALKIAE